MHINEGFSKLAESLFIADRKAREAVEARANLEKKLASKKKEENESKLRELAQKAREERAGLRPVKGKDDDEDVAERDELRNARHKERARQRNIDRAAPDRRAKLERNRERDISEQIALGIPAKTAASGEGLFDARLFNQSAGMNSGFEDDEAYNVYSEAWRKGSNIGSNIYRPSKNADKDMYGGEDLDELRKTNRFRDSPSSALRPRPMVSLPLFSGSCRTRSSAARSAAAAARRRPGRVRCRYVSPDNLAANSNLFCNVTTLFRHLGAPSCSLHRPLFTVREGRGPVRPRPVLGHGQEGERQQEEQGRRRAQQGQQEEEEGLLKKFPTASFTCIYIMHMHTPGSIERLMREILTTVCSFPRF